MIFSDLIDITNGTLLQLRVDRPVTNLITDTRKAVIQEGSVFFAIQGTHHDGHKYIQSLYNAGIRQFIIERDIPVQE